MEAKSTQDINKEKKINLKKEILDWGRTIALAFVVAYIITSFVKPTLVIGNSMLPTFQNSNYLLINRVAYLNKMPNHGDVVVFDTNLPQEKILIKRVIGVEGDKITIKQGKVYVNDNLIVEPYINEPFTSGDIDTIVPKGTVFVMGDNRNHSFDSRYSEVGFIDKDIIIGKAFFRLLPFNEMGKL